MSQFPNQFTAKRTSVDPSNTFKIDPYNSNGQRNGYGWVPVNASTNWISPNYRGEKPTQQMPGPKKPG